MGRGSIIYGKCAQFLPEELGFLNSSLGEFNQGSLHEGQSDFYNQVREMVSTGIQTVQHGRTC